MADAIRSRPPWLGFLLTRPKLTASAQNCPHKFSNRVKIGWKLNSEMIIEQKTEKMNIQFSLKKKEGDLVAS